MFSKFSEKTRKIFNIAIEEMLELHHPYVGSIHLLLALLKHDEIVADALNKYNVNYKVAREELIKLVGRGNSDTTFVLYTPLLKRIIENAVIMSKECNQNLVNNMHLFISILEESDGLAIKVLQNLDVDTDQLYDEVSDKIYEDKNKNSERKLVEEFGICLNNMVESLDPVIGRDADINRVIEVLARRKKNNPLLIGDAGVGKTAIVEELVRRIVNNDVPSNLANKNVYQIEMASLIAGTKYRGEFEERIEKLLKEVENDPDVILFIDEIHTIIGAGGAEGAIDASNILKPALARGKIHLIGATTIEEYKKTIENDKAFDRRFQKIMIKELNYEDTLKVLLMTKNIYEDYHNVKISDDVIKYIVSASERYVYNKHQPDKSIDIIDSVASLVKVNNSKNNNIYKNLEEELCKIKSEKRIAIENQDFKSASNYKISEKRIIRKIDKLKRNSNIKNSPIITNSDVDKVIYNMTGIIVNSKDINSDLKKLKVNLESKVLGQEKAIESLIEVTKRIKLNIDNKSRPHSLLFVGSTGVGKTFLAKEYAALMYGKNNFIRFDMSEYKEEYSISKIVGSSSGYVGYNDKKNKLEEVKNKPYSVILLDEIEKAHPSVINLFLQILDEGHITDASGNLVRFDNTLIIMTSNIGSNNKKIGFLDNKEEINNSLKEQLPLEFINRIDEVVLFNNLDLNTIKEITKNRIDSIKFEYSKMGINININNRVLDEIISNCDYKKYGARSIDRVLKCKVLNHIIDEILDGNKDIALDKIPNQ